MTTLVKEENKNEVITFRVSPEIKRGLELVANSHQRTKSFVVEELVSDYVQEELRRKKEIEEAVGEIEKGVFTSHKKVMSWLDKMARTGKKISRPKPDIIFDKNKK